MTIVDLWSCVAVDFVVSRTKFSSATYPTASLDINQADETYLAGRAAVDGYVYMAILHSRPLPGRPTVAHNVFRVRATVRGSV